MFTTKGNLILTSSFQNQLQVSTIWCWHCSLYIQQLSLQPLLNCTPTVSLLLPLLTLGAHAHSEGYCSCLVCMCVGVSTLICRLTHWNHKRDIPTDSLQYRNHFIVIAFTFCASNDAFLCINIMRFSHCSKSCGVVGSLVSCVAAFFCVQTPPPFTGVPLPACTIMYFCIFPVPCTLAFLLQLCALFVELLSTLT